MMTELVALLRGVNVGGRHLVRMADLRELVDELGGADVRTFLNSGNVRFSTREAAGAFADRLEQALGERYGFEVPVMIRTTMQLRSLLAENPYPGGDPKQVTLALTSARVPAGASERLAALATAAERFELRSREVFIEFGAGIGRSKLAAGLGRALGVPVTVRNLVTLEKILEPVDVVTLSTSAPVPGAIPSPRSVDPDLPAHLDQLATPALLVDRTRLETNIAAMAQTLARAGVALRPHVKTSKCWEVARRQLEAGAIGFTCSTPAEVCWLLEHEVADLFWAHLPVGPVKVAFALDAAATGRVTIELDSFEAALPVSTAAEERGVSVPYLLEVNTGQGRTGVDADEALALLDRLVELPGLRCRGITTHEGQLTGVAAVEERGRVGADVGSAMVRLAEQLRTAGHELEIVSVGSTPGVASVPLTSGVSEARPGTYVFYDGTQLRLGSATLEQCALSVLARVVNAARDGRAIVDAGSKAMSSDAIGAMGGLGLVCDLQLNPLAGITFAEGNEEHGYLTGPGTAALSVGDLVRIVPNHACGTVNMWSRLHVLDEGGDHPGVVEVWPIEARH